MNASDSSLTADRRIETIDRIADLGRWERQWTHDLAREIELRDSSGEPAIATARRVMARMRGSLHGPDWADGYLAGREDALDRVDHDRDAARGAQGS